MVTKASINLEDHVAKWLDRLEGDETRTDMINTDIFFYARLIRSGIVSVVSKITYNEFKVLLGAFNGWLINSSIRPEMVIMQIEDYHRFEPEFVYNCKELNVDGKKLMETVRDFNEMECYALLDYARRYWNVKTFSVEEGIEKIGMNKDIFKQDEAV
jgi:hypothetical protein